MKDFVKLYYALDQATGSNQKKDHLVAYWETADEKSATWACALLSGTYRKRLVPSSLARKWVCEILKYPEWLYGASYEIVGDSAETIAKLLPPNGDNLKNQDAPLYQIMDELLACKSKGEEVLKNWVTEKWKTFDADTRFVFNKLITGGFRVGVAKISVYKSLATAFKLNYEDVALRLIGKWSPLENTLNELIFNSTQLFDQAKPYPFMLAKPLETEPEELGDIKNWLVEYKWDGIRGQIVKRRSEVNIWSRGEELVTGQFPELVTQFARIKEDFVLDGELLPIKDKEVLPFNVLQTRLNRKKVSNKLIEVNPVGFIAYDLLELGGKDLRSLTQKERRFSLEKIAEKWAFRISTRLDFKSWDLAKDARESAREIGSEGLMIKRLSSTYQVGRVNDTWYKFKSDPYTVDAILLYAQAGRGRRANLYTDYSLAVWDGDNLVVFAKAYSGLTDEELKEVDKFIKANTKERFGPVRSVKPELVFEVAFEGIQESPRHKAGIAVRFPRLKRWRKDKKASEADTLDTVKALLKPHN